MEHAFFELFGRESVDVVEELIRTGELDKVLELFTELEQIVLEEEEWLRDVQTIFRKKLNAGFGFSPMQEIRQRAKLEEFIPPQSWSDTADAKGSHRYNFSNQQTKILYKWLEENVDDPFADTETIEELAEKTNLTFSQVKNWFINNRRRKLPDIEKKIEKMNKKKRKKEKAKSNESKSRHKDKVKEETDSVAMAESFERFGSRPRRSCNIGRKYDGFIHFDAIALRRGPSRPDQENTISQPDARNKWINCNDDADCDCRVSEEDYVYPSESDPDSEPTPSLGESSELGSEASESDPEPPKSVFKRSEKPVKEKKLSRKPFHPLLKDIPTPRTLMLCRKPRAMYSDIIADAPTIHSSEMKIEAALENVVLAEVKLEHDGLVSSSEFSKSKFKPRKLDNLNDSESEADPYEEYDLTFSRDHAPKFYNDSEDVSQSTPANRSVDYSNSSISSQLEEFSSKYSLDMDENPLFVDIFDIFREPAKVVSSATAEETWKPFTFGSFMRCNNNNSNGRVPPNSPFGGRTTDEMLSYDPVKRKSSPVVSVRAEVIKPITSACKPSRKYHLKTPARTKDNFVVDSDTEEFDPDEDYFPFC